METELERRKREGAARLDAVRREKREHEDEEANERRARDDAKLRLAVGRYRYRTLRSGVFWCAIPALPLFGIAIFAVSFDLLPSDLGVSLVMGTLLWLFPSIWLWASDVAWRASAGAMRAECDWIDSRPFAVRGYLEWLRRNDESMQLVVHGARVRARIQDLLLLAASVYPNVSAGSESKQRDDRVELTFSDLSHEGDDQRARVFHDLVDRVLVPLHAEMRFESIEIPQR